MDGEAEAPENSTDQPRHSSALRPPISDEALWTPAELAKFLGYAESTITRLTNKPGALPPRVAGLSKPRWVPQVCREWAAHRSGRSAVRRGRPRRPV